MPVYALLENCDLNSVQQKPFEELINNKIEEKETETNNEIDDSVEPINDDEDKKRIQRAVSAVEIAEKKKRTPPHFHVTYWMFYPFSEGKTICVLDLGYLGSWPIPLVGGKCFGKFKEYGSHVGDWEHMSLFFKVRRPSLSRNLILCLF